MSLMAPVKRKRSGFSVVNYWIGAYKAAKGEPKGHTSAVSRQSKIQFNQVMSALKTHYDFDSSMVMRLIDYMYTHNPLGFEKLTDYGSITALRASAPSFVKWIKNNERLISKVGIVAALHQTVPNLEESDKEMLSMMDEMRDSYRQAQ
jgi:hypothetical protein